MTNVNGPQMKGRNLFSCILILFLGASATSAETFSVHYSRVPNGISDGTIWVAASDGSFDQPITTGEWPGSRPTGTRSCFTVARAAIQVGMISMSEMW